MTCFRMATVVALVACFAPAADARMRVDGTYCGSLYAGEQLVDAVTKLETASNGEIRGIYEFMEGGLTISGGLLAITIGADRKADFHWIDKYGVGRLVVTFAEDASSFSGLWGSGEDEPQHPWFGQRCKDAAAPGLTT